jgi:trehalose-phosphatase
VKPATALGEEIAELLAPLRAEPGVTAILSDIDGTLAPIEADPQAAAVPTETREALRELTRRFALVACISGRRADEARRLIGVEEIAYAGNHGFELLPPGAGEPVLDPAVAGRIEAARRFVSALDPDALRAAGLRVEDKGPIQAIHWRGTADEVEAEQRAGKIAAEAQAAGLVPRRGRKVLEIRPLAGIDKGSAVHRLLREREVELALFGGDDETDLDAFRALRWLKQAGRLRLAVCIGVASEEAPAGLDEQTDGMVQGTEGFLALIQSLAEPPSDPAAA